MLSNTECQVVFPIRPMRMARPPSFHPLQQILRRQLSAETPCPRTRRCRFQKVRHGATAAKNTACRCLAFSFPRQRRPTIHRYAARTQPQPAAAGWLSSSTDIPITRTTSTDRALRAPVAVQRAARCASAAISAPRARRGMRAQSKPCCCCHCGSAAPADPTELIIISERTPCRSESRIDDAPAPALLPPCLPLPA